MDELFTISFNYKGRHYDLNTKFLRVGFVHQFHVLLDERTLIFELDEEWEYRVIDTALASHSRKIDEELLEVIVNKIFALH